jgi:hypothetical protein
MLSEETSHTQMRLCGFNFMLVIRAQMVLPIQLRKRLDDPSHLLPQVQVQWRLMLLSLGQTFLVRKMQLILVPGAHQQPEHSYSLVSSPQTPTQQETLSLSLRDH